MFLSKLFCISFFLGSVAMASSRTIGNSGAVAAGDDVSVTSTSGEALFQSVILLNTGSADLVIEGLTVVLPEGVLDITDHKVKLPAGKPVEFSLGTTGSVIQEVDFSADGPSPDIQISGSEVSSMN